MAGQVLAAVFFSVVGHVQAVDTAANYSQSAGNWQHNSHRGTGVWGDWNFSRSGGNNDGRFIGSSIPGGSDINTDGKSFALFAHSGTFSQVDRYFAWPRLVTGDVLSFQMAVNQRQQGSYGVVLRNATPSTVWKFETKRLSGTGGNWVNDSDVGLNAFHSNTIFTVTLTQRANDLVWHIQRSGGRTESATGTNSIPSGTINYIRFYADNKESSNPDSNLYFNNLNLVRNFRGDAPLTLGERRFPGFVPSHTLRFEHPTANSVTFRSSNDGFTTSYPLTRSGDVWSMDIRAANLPAGFHRFKFRINSVFESGEDRYLFIDKDGQLAKPPAVYLTWQRDPTTTMTVHWLNQDAAANGIRYRLRGFDGVWTTTVADEQRIFPYTERQIHIAELTGLQPDREYEFEVDGYEETFWFITMPTSLDRPLKAAFGGDIDYRTAAHKVTREMAKLDPAFAVIGGDLSYSDGRADRVWIEYIYFSMFYHEFRSPEGRMIPLIVGIGNHEVKKGWYANYPHVDNTDAWREREAPFFFVPYAFPGQPGYNVLDFGDYLSVVLTDTDHVNPSEGAQRDWLWATLDARRHIRHLFPIIHVQMYPSSTSRNSTDPYHQKLRDQWLQIFQDSGVRMVFEHHDHTFKRTPPLLNDAINPEGIVFMGDGAWGRETRSVKVTEGRSDLQVALSEQHAYLVTLTDEGRLLQAVNEDGVIIDTFYQTADGIPPAPAQLAQQRVTSTSATLTWAPAVRANRYRLYRDGVEIGTTSGTSLTDTNRTPSSSATYTVTAFNRSGESPSSTSLVVATPAAAPTPASPSGLTVEPLTPTSANLRWNAVTGAYIYDIYRGGVKIAETVETFWTDGGLTPEQSYSYEVRARNNSGTSASSTSVPVTQPTAWSGFTLDGQPDSGGYQLSQPAMRLYAAIRGSQLYVATWTPAGGTSDHFIFVTDRLLPAATQRAPWNKKGFIARPSGTPYIGAESTTSTFIGWFNAGPSATAFRSAVDGERIEGVIDLVETFGYMPEMIYLAAAAYGTADLQSLRSQGPEGNGDENIDPDEFLAIPVAAIRDNEGVGYYERLDPARGFELHSDSSGPIDPFTVRWSVVPGRQYHVWRTTNLSDPSAWVALTAGAPITAPSGADYHTFHDAEGADLNNAFYRIQVLNR